MNSFLLVVLLGNVSVALERIDEVAVDLKKTFPIYIHPGRTTTLDLPCSISYAIPGPNGDVKVEIGPDRDSSLLIWLTSRASAPTNLTVRCEDRVIVFDIIPSRASHQDYLKIKSISNGQIYKKPIYSSATFKESSEKPRKLRLIRSSEDK